MHAAGGSTGGGAGPCKAHCKVLATLFLLLRQLCDAAARGTRANPHSFRSERALAHTTVQQLAAEQNKCSTACKSPGLALCASAAPLHRLHLLTFPVPERLAAFLVRPKVCATEPGRQ